MRHRKWKSKRFAAVHPRRGQKYRMAQLCAALSRGERPSVEMLSDIFGVSVGLIYQARAAAGPAKHGKGHAHAVKHNGHDRPNGNKQYLPAIAPATIPVDPWMVAEALVREHGPETAFDKLIVPRL